MILKENHTRVQKFNISGDIVNNNNNKDPQKCEDSPKGIRNVHSVKTINYPSVLMKDIKTAKSSNKCEYVIQTTPQTQTSISPFVPQPPNSLLPPPILEPIQSIFYQFIMF